MHLHLLFLTGGGGVPPALAVVFTGKGPAVMVVVMRVGGRVGEGGEGVCGVDGIAGREVLLGRLPG